MLILAISTSSLIGSISLSEDSNLISEVYLNEGTTHGKELVFQIKRMIESNKVKIDDIGLFVVDIGPGSYTGLRIGLICAKTFAYFLKKKIVGISSLDALAFEYAVEDSRVFKSRFLMPIIDAKCDMVYTAVYEIDKDKFYRRTDYLVANVEKLGAYFSDELTILTEKGKSYNTLLKSYLKEKQILVREKIYPKISFLNKLAFQRMMNNEYDEISNLHPLYLRPSYAEVNLMKKTKGI